VDQFNRDTSFTWSAWSRGHDDPIDLVHPIHHAIDVDLVVAYHFTSAPRPVRAWYRLKVNES
jgi:hypothetical protein